MQVYVSAIVSRHYMQCMHPFMGKQFDDYITVLVWHPVTSYA